MMSDDTDLRERPSDQQRARAIFSAMDFELLKEALGEFIRDLPEDDKRSPQAAALYHRLGRAA